MSWLDTSFLKEDEKRCKVCELPFSGKEKVVIHDDGKVVVKFVECQRCKTKLVLDVARHEEFY